LIYRNLTFLRFNYDLQIMNMANCTKPKIKMTKEAESDVNCIDAG